MKSNNNNYKSLFDISNRSSTIGSGLKTQSHSPINRIEKPNNENLKTSICIYCKSGKNLCGRNKCDLIEKTEAGLRNKKSRITLKIDGATPPSVFVGTSGYQDIYIGPMVPQYYDNTEILDTPERWIGKSVDEIINYRHSLTLGTKRINALKTNLEELFVENLQMIAMSSQPIDTEVTLTKIPNTRITLNPEMQPFGPSAPIKHFKSSNFRVDTRIEKAYNDKDLLSRDGIMNLYSQGVSISRIQKAFSMGMFGLGKKRKLVPTRWSITAVENNISLALLEEIKKSDTIDNYRVFSFRNLDNLFTVILSPEKWRLELLEAWHPGTIWNSNGTLPVIISDYEPFQGRNSYAKVGGSYYAARLAVTERLERDRRQASAIIFREIQQGYKIPLGVWNIRESIRAAIRKKPDEFESFHSALTHINSVLTIKLDKWIEASTLLKETFIQRKISDY